MRNFEFMGPKYDDALVKSFLFGQLTRYEKKEEMYVIIKDYINNNLPKSKKLDGLDNMCVQEVIEYFDSVIPSNIITKYNVLNTLVRGMELIDRAPIRFMRQIGGTPRTEFISDQAGGIETIIYSKESNISNISIELCDMMDILFVQQPKCRRR